MTDEEKIDSILTRIDKVVPNDVDKNVTFEGLSFLVKAHVFDPSKGKSTRRIFDTINLFPPSRNDRILELGTGCGVLPMKLWVMGYKKVTVTDVDKVALDNAKHNFDSYGMDIKVVQSDMFESVSGEFDFIIFNAPATHPRRFGSSVKGTVSLYDPDGSLKHKFMKGVEKCLSKNGIALMMYTRYFNFDPLAKLDFSNFDLTYALVEKDDISESGALILRKKN